MSSLIERQAAIDALAEWHDEAITNRLNNLPSAQQWISCSERLPEKDGEYLTTTEDGLYDVEYYGDGEWYYDDVVAWMPFPEWKGEDDD